jgi:SAM-dependent methyltransferase
MPSSPPTDRPSTFALLAEFYDSVYFWKDYPLEARRVRELVRRYGPPGARSLLDVGCGTGAHLAELTRWFECAGLDSSPDMLAVARRRLSSVPLKQGRMESFQLGRRFDVITCLFSAIGYVRTESGLRRTARTFASHLNDGGVAIVEPWLTPGQVRVGRVHLAVSGSKDHPIARMNTNVRRGGLSVMDMHYLVGGRRGVRHWVERHEMGLFSRATMRAAFTAAGLRVRYVPSRFSTRRGLYIATKPGPRP